MVLALLLASPTPAQAHADLIVSDPVNGAVLEVAPTALRLEFNEPVTYVSSQLRTSGGADISSNATLDTDVLSVTPADALGSGTYQLRWQVVSADGHPVAGVLGFTVGDLPAAVASSATPQLVAATGQDSADASRVALDRALESLGWFALAAALGAAWRRSRNLRALALLAALFPALRLLDAADVFGSNMFRLGEVKAMTFACAAAALLLVTRRLAWPSAGLFALSGLVAGHPLLLEPSWLMRVAQALHLFGALVWVAAVLGAFTATSPSDVRAVSRRALIGVGMLVPSALLIASGFIFEPGTHGDRLRIKVAFVVAALLLGAFHHLRIRRHGRRPAHTTLVAEIALLVMVAILSASLTANTPERFQQAAPAAISPAIPASTSQDTIAPSLQVRDEISTEIVFDDGSTGQIHIPASPFAESSQLHVTAQAADGSTLQVEQAEFELNSEQLEIFGLRGALTGGVVASGEITFPEPGKYQLIIHLTIDTFTTSTGVVEITTRSTP
jgi:copper transport protein